MRIRDGEETEKTKEPVFLLSEKLKNKTAVRANGSY